MRTVGRIVSVQRGGIAASLAYLVLLGVSTALVSPPLENILRDMMMVSISPFTQAPRNIVVVSITEQTLANFRYRSPPDRGFLADIVARIESAHPLVIGIDLLFDQATEPQKDTRLETVIEAASVPVVIASASRADGLTQRQSDYLNAFAPSAKRGLAALLHDNLDGVVRGAFPGREVEGGWTPSFAAAIAAATGVSSGRRPEEMVYYRTANSLPFNFSTYPAQAVPLAPLSWFEGKYVLIGVDLQQIDRHPTPFALLSGAEIGDLPGVAIHAHSLARLLSGNRITIPWPAMGYAPMLLVGLFCLWIVSRPIPVVFKPLAVAGAVLLVWIGEAWAFARFAILVPMVAPALLVLGLSAFVGFLAWRRDANARHFIQNAFSKYVSPAVVAAIVKEPNALHLGGERRDVTCVFTDVEGFTSLSEKLAPEVLAEVLNEYLHGLCELFIEHGATIDKVIGDAVVGFFGAPVAQNDQAERAVSLALAVQDLAQRLRERLAGRGHSFGATRIGIHGGPAIVGNFGGNRFFNYTAIGDTVNTAARLEGANKYIGTKNCISAEVAKQTARFLLRPVGVLHLKGKNQGIEAFEAMSRTSENIILCEEYAKAYALLATGDELATAAFELLVTNYPQDALIAFHHGRLASGRFRADIHLAGK
ncbi:adenylate/guanylate cyclase domain-containing protein [Mesorhizobium sp. M2D.F.Ca.ET.185.01.1.1]|nr:adenylate/guanylate cyclase domain-containing protein [Mesorhizobium sp. M2D.F.Ca.ET.140.01.1.1]TGP15938.1 adenylate/guanylate cyclase domain-containing protein [Mesorhizobium sp. M2D.F.Ca.ET.233.01.1.1]TGP32635.1 adenylate/guanylate cyclase domain-containing protein [Mesorhizobium sp. M2D.F.Ca.ET.232.01.1.1]TGP57955.1 adenylate/guanylate cyclase domain-containing protein [Mesorhizobium sp. M2D.F.Ca.ET.226.01.1.1]TGP67045.1 adenylate/guanylate cyclase domain-containing protein [Mesorhizobium